MTVSILSSLDQTELIQLAADASRRQDAAAALTYLKEAAQRPDATATARLLLGAEYAQLGMGERAIAEYEAALAMDPALGIARLQLGLLWATQGDATRACVTLQPLTEDDPASDPLSLFAQGLLYLMRDAFGEAIHCLQAGIERNSTNPALNADMQKLIDRITPQAAAESAQGRVEPGESQHLFLSAYTGKLH